MPGRGELFVRDTGGEGAPVLLLHGWTVSADLNWLTMYEPLRAAGYRVIALDHRGHGRGLRTPADFRLVDCAGDAAALTAHLGIGPVLAVGYSMGGPIAQLMARDHRERVAAVVLCATATDWQDPRIRYLWNGMALLRLALGLFPQRSWHTLFRLAGFPATLGASWVTAELTRGSARDIAEAGRELGRFDSRPWLGSLDTPAAVVVTARDTAVPPTKQRELARLLRAPTFEVDGDHLAVAARREPFADALLGALNAVRAPGERAAA